MRDNKETGEQSTLVYTGEIVLKQPDSLLEWDDWLCRRGEAVDLVYLGFSKALDIVSHSIILDKMTTYGLDKWTVR